MDRIIYTRRYGGSDIPVVVLSETFAPRYFNPAAAADCMIPMRTDIAACIGGADVTEACRTAARTLQTDIRGTLGRWWKQEFDIHVEKCGQDVALLFRQIEDATPYSVRAVMQMAFGYDHLMGHELHNILTAADAACIADPRDERARLLRRDALRGIRTAKCMRLLGRKGVCCPVEMASLTELLFRPLADHIKLRFGRTVSLEIPRGMHCVVKADLEWFRTTFYNMIRDALHHSGAGDDPLVITLENKPDGCALIVPGCDPAFFQLGSEQILAGHLPMDVNGEVPGLDACRLLAYRMQGDLRCVDHPQKGPSLAYVVPFACTSPVGIPHIRAVLEENISSLELEFSILEERTS